MCSLLQSEPPAAWAGFSQHHGLRCRLAADTPVVFRMPTVEFLEVFAPPYSDSWDDMFAGLAGDPVESATVGVLCEQLRAHGSFREPVCVDPVELRLWNGCHRVAATVATGTAFIDVSYDEPPEQTGLVELLLAADGIDDDTFELLSSVLRSFPADALKGVWVESFGVSSFRGEMTADFAWPPSEAGMLAAAVQERIDSYDLRVRVAAAFELTDDFDRGRPLWSSPQPAL